jgi:hypothetical protein
VLIASRDDHARVHTNKNDAYRIRHTDEATTIQINTTTELSICTAPPPPRFGEPDKTNELVISIESSSRRTTAWRHE